MAVYWIDVFTLVVIFLVIFVVISVYILVVILVTVSVFILVVIFFKFLLCEVKLFASFTLFVIEHTHKLFMQKSTM